MFKFILKTLQLLCCALIVFSAGLLITSHFNLAYSTNCRIIEKSVEKVNSAQSVCYRLKFVVEYIVKHQYFFKTTYVPIRTTTYNSPDLSKPNNCGAEEAMQRQLDLYPANKTYPCWYHSSKYPQVLFFYKPHMPLAMITFFKEILIGAIITLIVVRILMLVLPFY